MDTATRMSDTASSEETARLRALVPLHTLPDDALATLLESATFETLRRGAILFQQGDADHENVYLLEGSVVLLSGKAVVERVRAGSDTARFPLAHQVPRKHSVRAESEVRIARVDSRRLSDLLARTRTVDYQVSDLEEASEDDWMSMLLQSRVLQQVPASNIQRVMMNVEQVGVTKGEDLIRQGDPGDYYYMITRGRAVVRRDVGDGRGPCELATLGPGDAFGEEALLSDSPRNSSVAMLQDGEVLRLSKEHFLQLIHNPLLDRLDMPAAQAKVDKGAIWLDLRSSDQYDESHLPGAINFPFESLRYQAASLAPDCHYVLYSNTGGRAMAGAFLLTERGFGVSVLEGGIQRPAPEARQISGGDENASATEVSAGPASTVDDAAMQARILEAEARAKELEERLRLAQKDQDGLAAERQQQLEQVRQAVDQARRKLIETEEQKRAALAAQQKAYSEMEGLTSSLEELQSERSSLLDRMFEIEGLDKQLQARLAKAERELIGERERAESATSSLDELSGRLNEILEKRELERAQHAQERGQLKEEMTALQMELEQAQLDLDGLHEQLAAREAESALLQQVQQQLAEVEAAGDAMQAERDGMRRQIESQQAQIEELQAAEQRLTALQSDVEARDRVAAEVAAQHDAQLAALSVERDGLAQRLADAEAKAAQSDQAHSDAQRQAAESAAALQAELEAARAQIDALRAEADRAAATAQSDTETLRKELQAALDGVREQADRQTAELQGELDQLRGENDALRSEQAESGRQVEQAHTRIAELETQLSRQTEQGRSELDAATAHVQELQAQVDQDRAALAEAQAQLAAVQGELHETQQRAGSAEMELAESRAERDALQSQLASGSEEASAAVEQSQARVAELERRLAERQEQAQQNAQQLQQELEDAHGAERRLQSRVGELEASLQAEQDAAAARLEAQQDELTEIRTALDDARAEHTQQAESWQAELAAAQALLDESQATLDSAQRASTTQTEDLQAQMEQLRNENEVLQARLTDDAEIDTQLARQQARVGELETRLAQEADQLAARQAELDALRAELDAEKRQSIEELAAANHEAQIAAKAREDELDELRRENVSLKAQAAHGKQDVDEAVATLRAEMAELAQKVEERDLALAAAHEQQAELIEALNAASAERETLQLAVSDKDDEQARLLDLENQVAEALRSHQNELLAHEQQQHHLREQLSEEGDRRRALQEEVERLNELLEALDEDQHASDDEVRAERDALLAEVAMRESEVEQLRGVLEEYVDQIRAAQSDDGDVSEVAALRAELEMVREQAIRDVAHMREKLATAETQKRRLQQADGREAISHEAMRQRIEELESSLAERQRELSGADESRHMLEDALEDANRQLDAVRRDLEKAQVEADEAVFSRREADNAREQLQAALYRLQEDAEEARVTDLRDERLKPSKRPIGIDSVATPNRWLPGLVGAGVLLAALEAASMLTGKGELFSVLLKLSGQ